MSVVAARVYKDVIVMSADSIMCNGWSKSTNTNFVKINAINEMVLGGCGTAEEMSLMWHYMNTHKPTNATEKEVLNFIIEFSKWKKDLTGNGCVDNVYLLVYDGHLFKIQSMFVYEINNYCAIGAGEDFSNTALHLGHSPSKAVKVACDLCCFVSEPIIEYVIHKETGLVEKEKYIKQKWIMSSDDSDKQVTDLTTYHFEN